MAKKATGKKKEGVKPPKGTKAGKSGTRAGASGGKGGTGGKSSG